MLHSAETVEHIPNWQVELVKRAPEQFLRGLIQSDGCRFENTGRDGWVRRLLL
jgi:hypothetical protein